VTLLDPDILLNVLIDERVEFIVVGGLAAVMQGATLTTFDLDIVPRLDPANIERLERALVALDARFRARPDLAPQRSHLVSRGHKLLRTRAGDLDVLGAIGDDEDYDDLRSDVVEISWDDLVVPVLGLHGLIRTKRAVGRNKDLLAIPILERLVAISHRTSEGDE